MGFFLAILLSVWALAMGAWFLVSKYFKSSDIDRVKARLLGTSRVKAAKGKKGVPAEKQVILNRTDNRNQFAQAVVEKYQLGPKLATLMEQAGLNWPPARVVQPDHHDVRFGIGDRVVVPAAPQADYGRWWPWWRPRFPGCM